MSILGSAGYRFSAKLIYVTGIAIYCIIVALFCVDLFSKHRKDDPQNKKIVWIVSILSIIIIASTDNLVISFVSAALICVVILMNLRGKPGIVLSAVFAVILTANIMGTIPTTSNGHLDITKYTPHIYCDTNPGGDRILSVSITEAKSWVSADYFITTQDGVFERRRKIASRDFFPSECTFLDSSTVMIDGEIISLRN